jgi:thiosulfate/3-mercaptopyruvate sulfurtransferase
MTLFLRLFSTFLVVCVIALFGSSSALAADSSTLQTISIDELVQILKSSQPKPLLFHVGPHMLYQQAHIPGSEFLGQGSTPEGQQNLRNRVAPLPKKTAIILYCGCCPWSHCPNVNPAYDTLKQLGFTNVKVLYLPNNFGADWAYKGYPTASGN